MVPAMPQPPPKRRFLLLPSGFLPSVAGSALSSQGWKLQAVTAATLVMMEEEEQSPAPSVTGVDICVGSPHKGVRGAGALGKTGAGFGVLVPSFRRQGSTAFEA